MRVRWNSFGANILRETDIKRKIAQNLKRKQIEVLTTFLPDQILNMNIIDQPQETFVGVLLFADVSGFTPLCEKYNKTGKGGIYRLTATLNAYIGAIVEVIYFYGGDVLKFSGDAFLAVWKAPPDICLYEVIHQVVVCALFIQQTIGCFETEVNILLKVKLAISSGNLTLSIIGNDTFRHYVVVGQAINDVKKAEHVSVSGDVILAPSAWGHLAPENYEVNVFPDGNVKVIRCLYSPQKKQLKVMYMEKFVVGQKLVEQHLAHRAMLHEKRRIDDATTDSKITDQFIASLPPRVATRIAMEYWNLPELNSFIVKPVKNQVEEKQPIEYLTEMREVTIQFINIVPVTFTESKLIPMVNKAYQVVCGIVTKVRGVVNKVSLFDKDAMMLVLFGLRGVKHELESQNALKSAFEIREALLKLNVKSVSVGVTNGLVYCGVVGHPLRREYTVIGGSVNKAARIMCAYENKVTCDHETFKSSKLASSYFLLQSAMKLKGIENAGHVFEYNEDFDIALEDLRDAVPLIGRDLEMEFIDFIIGNPAKAGDYHAVCFRSEPKIGKTKLLMTALQKHANSEQFVAYVSLQPGIKRPYFAVSSVYQKIYDIASKTLGETEIFNLYPDLWNFNDILQETSSISLSQGSTPSSKEAIFTNFIQLTQKGPHKFSVIFIDDVQYIDNKSFEVLEVALKAHSIRLITAGCFEAENTWDIMWKLSLCNQIKLLDLDPIKNEFVVELICKFLNVKGVSCKLAALVGKTCEGRPGWIQMCLLRLINNCELEVKYTKQLDLEFIFLDSITDSSTVLVAALSSKYLQRTEDITLTAISLDLFDSFSPYEQLVIKTAAVLGEIFSRTILIVLLKYPNEQLFTVAIKNLFDDEVFECASKYVNGGGGGVQVKQATCLCYMDDGDYIRSDEHTDLPRYAFCKLIHFKSRNIRLIAYELLPSNQKKELHLRITDLLESQNNACPNCLRDNSASVIHLQLFKEVIKYCSEEDGYINDYENENDPFPDSTELFKKIVREMIRKQPNDDSDDSKEIPKRKVWDPTTCFCLEILSRVYMDLIHHSHCAQHLGKKVFFMYQYGVILTILNELDDAIPILNEASELCLVDCTENYIFTGGFKKILVGKLHSLLCVIYFRLGNLQAAKNHVMIAFRQYDVPMISFNYSLPYSLLNRVCLMKLEKLFNGHVARHNSMRQMDFGITLGIASNIFAAEGKWEFARQLLARSLSCLRNCNSNLDTLCDVYCNAIDLYNYCGDQHICERLERCFTQDLLRHYAKNSTTELYALARLIAVLFQTKVMNGNITVSIRQGYRALELNMMVQAYYLQIYMIPILSSILIVSQRVDEAVHLIRILYNIGRKYNVQGFIAYYGSCLELMIESNFYLEPFDLIYNFAKQYFSAHQTHQNFTTLENRLILLLYNHSLRDGKSSAFWMNLYNWDGEQPYTILAIQNLLRSTECILLELVRGFETHKRFEKHKINRAKFFLNQCKLVAGKWKFFKPRYLHYKAYFCRLRGKKRKALSLLNQACQVAKKQGNVLEECWVTLHKSYWYGGFSFQTDQLKVIAWQSAKTYNSLQWCQILYALPYN